MWDWNGTLLDDLEIVVEAVNVGIARFGMPPIDENGYRDHFTRPVRAFYDSLFGRLVSDMEWDDLNKSFHDEYHARLHRATLTSDALSAVSRVEELGWSQSLLSMSVHDRLLEAVAARGLADRFSLISGLTGVTGGLKTEHLSIHVDAVGAHPNRVVVIGDTPDDVTAARDLGAKAVLYDGGSHHLPVLQAQGAPVAHSLESAVDLAAEALASEGAEAPT